MKAITVAIMHNELWAWQACQEVQIGQLRCADMCHSFFGPTIRQQSTEDGTLRANDH